MSRDEIIELLKSNDRAVERALVVLFERQTMVEQNTESTRVNNNRGFNSAHGRIGASMAKDVLRRGRLTPKQIAYWRRPNAKGTPRIGIYWAQLAEAAAEKAARKAA